MNSLRQYCNKTSCIKYEYCHLKYHFLAVPCTEFIEISCLSCIFAEHDYSSRESGPGSDAVTCNENGFKVIINEFVEIVDNATCSKFLGKRVIVGGRRKNKRF